MNFFFFILFIPLALGLPCISRGGVRIVHYNTDGINSSDLELGKKSSKVLALKSVLKDLDPDILSLSGVEFERDKSNIDKILEFASLQQWFLGIPKFWKRYQTKTYPPGEGKYSGGLITVIKVLSMTSFDQVLWKDFNPNRKLETFDMPDGTAVRPDSIKLFEKGFTDFVLEISGKEVHVIAFDATPFLSKGNMKTSNYIRNEDQLLFLEWYLTGRTTFDVPKIPFVTPLPEQKSQTFLALGSWFTDYKNVNNSGSVVINRLREKNTMFVDPGSATYLSGGFDQTRFVGYFDYIIASSDLDVKTAGVAFPESHRQDLGCEKDQGDHKKPPQGMSLTSYAQGDKKCQVFVSDDYFTYRTSSRHFPVWAEFSFSKKSKN